MWFPMWHTNACTDTSSPSVGGDRWWCRRAKGTGFLPVSVCNKLKYLWNDAFENNGWRPTWVGMNFRCVLFLSYIDITCGEQLLINIKEWDLHWNSQISWYQDYMCFRRVHGNLGNLSQLLMVCELRQIQRDRFPKHHDHLKQQL